MTDPNKQEFHAWAYDDLLTNTTRGVLAEYIVATALGIVDTKRVEWDKHDLEVDGIGVEVKSAAYVYVFCLLEGEIREHVDPLDVTQWTFYVLPTSVLNREVPVQKSIGLEPLRALTPSGHTYDELETAIRTAAEVNRGA